MGIPLAMASAMYGSAGVVVDPAPVPEVVLKVSAEAEGRVRHPLTCDNDPLRSSSDGSGNEFKVELLVRDEDVDLGKGGDVRDVEGLLEGRLGRSVVEEGLIRKEGAEVTLINGCHGA